MDAMSKLLIERECEALSVAYARHLDYHDYDAFCDLFTEDAHLDAGGALTGREKIRGAMARRRDTLRSRHVLTNLYVDVMDNDTAAGMVYLSLYRHTGLESLESGPVEFDAPAAIGHYTDRYVRTPEGFRIASRILSFAFVNSAKF